MTRCRGLLMLAAFIALCAGGIGGILRATAHNPALGESASYPVNQLEGFELSIEEPSWSPFRGYTLRYDITISSEEVYYLTTNTGPKSPERLERLTDGQWYRLEAQRPETHNSLTFDLGGSETTGFGGSLVQKYAGYGTRLEPGCYRLTLELTDQQENCHYLAAEFTVE